MLIFTENKRRSTGLAVTTNPRVTLASVGLGEATQAQAEAGTITAKFMSPLRVAQALDGGQLSAVLTTVAVSGYLVRSAPVTETGTTHTVAATTTHLICNNAGSVTVTLPAAASFTGRELYILNINGAQTVVSASSNVIPKAGGSAGTAILAAADGAWAFMVSDGTSWQIMAGS